MLVLGSNSVFPGSRDYLFDQRISLFDQRIRGLVEHYYCIDLRINFSIACEKSGNEERAQDLVGLGSILTICMGSSFVSYISQVIPLLCVCFFYIFVPKKSIFLSS